MTCLYMRVQLVVCSGHLQELLERVEVRLLQVKLVMTLALILEVRRRDCQSVVKWRVC
jgi:hypothetical protein